MDRIVLISNVKDNRNDNGGTSSQSRCPAESRGIHSWTPVEPTQLGRL